MKNVFGARVITEKRTGVIEERRGTLEFRYSVGQPDTYVFTADIYAYRENIHPDRHLGWWRFELPPGRGRAILQMNFQHLGHESVQVTGVGFNLLPTDSWFNPKYAFDPLADLLLVVRDTSGKKRRIEPALLKFVDRDILRSFYDRQYASEGYTAPEDAPFLHELHKFKLARLKDLFARHITGGRVVDVGCGRSLFTEIEDKFPFTVYAGDLNFESVRDRAAAVPDQRWGVFDAAALPFRDEQFDGLFAGEVIEHVADVHETLQEWRRVLKPGGVAIITTPNKQRLAALVDGVESPYSRDHLNELSYRELTRVSLPNAGFSFVEQSCLYVELWLQNLFNRHRVEDFLQREGNTSDYVSVMRRLFPLGRWIPQISLALIIVARKK